MITFSIVFFLLKIIFSRIRKSSLSNQKYLTREKVVLITGGCMGIGKELIKILINKFNCRIINIDIRDDLFDSLNDIVENKENQIQNYKCDLSNFEELDKTLIKIFEKNTVIHFLINNAAVAFNDFIYNLKEKQVIKSIEVNLISPLLLTKKFLSVMQRFDDEEIHVVNICSNLSHVVSRKSVPYITSKWGLFGMHDSIRYGILFFLYFRLYILN